MPVGGAVGLVPELLLRVGAMVKEDQGGLLMEEYGVLMNTSRECKSRGGTSSRSWSLYIKVVHGGAERWGLLAFVAIITLVTLV